MNLDQSNLFNNHRWPNLTFINNPIHQSNHHLNMNFEQSNLVNNHAWPSLDLSTITLSSYVIICIHILLSSSASSLRSFTFSFFPRKKQTFSNYLPQRVDDPCASTWMPPFDYRDHHWLLHSRFVQVPFHHT